MGENCFYHSDRQPVGVCAGCGKALCYECAVRRDNEVFCMEECRVIFSYKRSPKRTRTIARIIAALCGIGTIIIFVWLFSDMSKFDFATRMILFLLAGGIAIWYIYWMIDFPRKGKIPHEISEQKKRLEQNNGAKVR